MELFKKYFLEREGLKIFENESGFFTYKLTDCKSEIHVMDIYLVPEKRGGAEIQFLFEKIVETAKDSGSRYVVGQVDLRASGNERSMGVMLKYGFKLLKTEGPVIKLVFDLEKI